MNRTVDINSHIADIRSIRLGLAMAQTELAKRAGVSLDDLRKSERGLIMPDNRLLTAVAHALSVPVDQLRAAHQRLVLMFRLTAAPVLGQWRFHG